jgi:hypothetical protein
MRSGTIAERRKTAASKMRVNALVALHAVRETEYQKA